MFFGLKNLLATFQIMMNDLFRDMIEVRDMVAFINNVIVGTETEKEHDDIMEKLLRRMVENNWFVKLEKCVWKVRKVGFLEMVIGPDRVKMKKEEV